MIVESLALASWLRPRVYRASDLTMDVVYPRVLPVATRFGCSRIASEPIDHNSTAALQGDNCPLRALAERPLSGGLISASGGFCQSVRDLRVALGDPVLHSGAGTGQPFLVPRPGRLEIGPSTNTPARVSTGRRVRRRSRNPRRRQDPQRTASIEPEPETLRMTSCGRPE